ncbi:hypothetical protein ACJX0J_022771, partial [Zea mays]
IFLAMFNMFFILRAVIFHKTLHADADADAFSTLLRSKAARNSIELIVYSESTALKRRTFTMINQLFSEYAAPHELYLSILMGQLLVVRKITFAVPKVISK